jgi:hypothetical protein
MRLYFKNNKNKRTGGIAQGVDKAINSILSIPHPKKKDKRNCQKKGENGHLLQFCK